MVNLPVIDMIRTGQNIGRLRKQGVALPNIDNPVVLAVVLQVRMDDILVTDTAAQKQISA